MQHCHFGARTDPCFARRQICFLMLFFFVLAWAIVDITCLAAQQAALPERVTLSGQVTDASSGQPLVGALVELQEVRRSVVTNGEGRFSFRGIHPGNHAVQVRMLGYATSLEVLEVREEGETFTIALYPDPVVLRGIEVQANRFERRRRAVPMSVRAFDREQLLTSGAFDAGEFVLRRANLHHITCPAGGNCVMFRGRPIQPTVYIDEAPAFGGLDQLAMYRPHELYLVEVFGGGRHIRAYTTWFMQRVATRNFSPMPILTF